MRLVVDAVAVRPGSAATIVGNLLQGWTAAAPGDEIIVLVGDRPQLPLPDAAKVESITSRSASLPPRLWAQSFGVRHAAKRLDADALLGGVTASVLLGAGCPYGVMVYDLRHELRPAQFPGRRRLARGLLYGWSFRRADALICISERTRRDLLVRRPHLRAKAHVALLGADHAAKWRAPPDDARPYVLAFGHFPNKNVDRVLRGWRLYGDKAAGVLLRVCGLAAEERAAAARLAAELGISGRVELLPWLPEGEFEAMFAGAAAVLFPSDFEGFGLPAVEALLLGVPLVISSDPALLEVTGGHAVVAADDAPESLAAAIERALALSKEQRAAGIEHARRFTWEATARRVRAALELLGPRSP
jgi:glycosyltransferase involved in cell wall biosynthesis